MSLGHWAVYLLLKVSLTGESVGKRHKVEAVKSRAEEKLAEMGGNE